MKYIGIISVQKINKLGLKEILNPIILKEYKNRYKIAEIKVSEKGFLKRKSVRRRLVKRSEKILKEIGVEEVVFSKKCKDILDDGQQKDLKKSYRIYLDYLLDAFCFCLEKAGKNSLRRLNIVDRNLMVFNYENLCKIISRIKYITLYTKDIEGAVSEAERLFYEFGIWIEVKRIENLTGINPQMLIDADRGIVRVGDVYLDGAEYISQSGEYCLDAAEEAAILGDEIDFEIKNWLSGKNVIKIS